MKKIIPILLIGMLILSGLGAVAISSDDVKPVLETTNNEIEMNGVPPTDYTDTNFDNTRATHTVLGEYQTATWCGYCKYAHGALKALYKGEWHDFYYVSLVDDKNTHAADRIDELGATGFPTVWWDGGYDVDIGSGSIPGAMATYNTSINSCGTRTVADIDVTISVSWIGSATMSITVTVENNEGSQYNGYLRCYVTEIASSFGWTDTGGHLYTFPFLDYAFDQGITVNAGGSWSDTVTWDGALHNNGMGTNYGSITEDNTFIIASVFATSGGFVDETAGKRVGSNRAPNTPSSPNPSNGATNINLNPTLSWIGGDPDWFDDIYYDVYFEEGDSSPDVLVSNNQPGTSYDPGTLDFDGTYYWKIVSQDEHGLTTNGPVWEFTTRGNDAPLIPSNPDPADGETDVNVNANLEWSGGDPDGDSVVYDVFFEAGNPDPSVLVSDDQSSTTYDPGIMDALTTYYWKIVSEDEFGEVTTGPIWSFTTTSGNNPPETPDIDGPTNGKAGTSYDYDFTATDPDGDDVKYYIDWGDGDTEWTGFSASGTPVIVSHTWDEEDTYTITAKAQDEHGLESDWATLEVEMPVNQQVINPLLQMILERFPNAFPILRTLLRL